MIFFWRMLESPRNGVNTGSDMQDGVMSKKPIRRWFDRAGVQRGYACWYTVHFFTGYLEPIKGHDRVLQFLRKHHQGGIKCKS
jgi:hypothetical protein